MLRNALLTIFCSSALIFAGGNAAPDEPNGEPWNDENGIVDTTEVEGTIVMIDEDEEMMIVDHMFGEDTIFWDDDTEFVPEDQEDQILTEGTEVVVEYITEEERNLATRIELADENGAAADEENGERDDEYDDEYEENGRRENDYNDEEWNDR
ncbi:hypothetical protein CHISP_1991 [Chitinispirillum alkaliphilum]|nr:hypothetical protein CHISP_1991 [Chitinispirillum alkaliphilum]